MLRLQLVPFQPLPETKIEVSCTLLNFEDGLVLQFQLDGDWESFKKLPPKTAPTRQDGLWKSTCFECFIAPVHQSSYTEFNIAPTGDWNAYNFDAYRTGMQPAADFLAPRIYQSFSTSQSTRTDVLIPKPDPLQEVLVHPTLVLESMTGAISYWAARHPLEKPDFHARSYFAVRL